MTREPPRARRVEPTRGAVGDRSRTPADHATRTVRTSHAVDGRIAKPSSIAARSTRGTAETFFDQAPDRRATGRARGPTG
jgi:hypothetical protein